MTEREYMTMSEPARPGRQWSDDAPQVIPAPGTDYCRPMYWPRLQCSYFQALGALRVLSEQFDRSVVCWAGLRDAEMRFQFSVPATDVEAFFSARYRPSVVYSPWNARSFGSGFAKTLTAARKHPQLAHYCAAVDRAAELGLTEKPDKATVGGVSPKTTQIIDFLEGRVILDPSHTRWAKACWRIDVPAPPPAPEPKKFKRGRPPKPKYKPAEIGARVALGAGGCAGSGDYGSLFLRAAVAHFGGRGGPDDWPMGGFAWSDSGYYPTALDVMLTIEGAMAFAYPWPDWCPFSACTRTPWTEPGTGGDYGTMWLPFWEGGLSWAEVQTALASGHDWDRVRRVARLPITDTADVRWRADGQIMRMSWGYEGQGSVRPVRHPVTVELTLAFSPDEGEQWHATVACDGSHVWSSDLVEERGDAEAAARAFIEAEWGDRATVLCREIVLTM